MTNDQKSRLILEKQNIEEARFREYARIRNINSFFLTNLTARYDVGYISGSTNILAENKVRADKSNEFFLQPGYGPFLEKIKLEGMIQRKNEKSDKGVATTLFYLNFTSNGILVYRLNSDVDDYVWQDWLLPKDNIEPHIKIKKTITKLKIPEEIISLP